MAGGLRFRIFGRLSRAMGL